jgi:hypothetical protein
MRTGNSHMGEEGAVAVGVAKLVLAVVRADAPSARLLK